MNARHTIGKAKILQTGLLAAALAWGCTVPVYASDDPDTDAQQLGQRAAQLAERATRLAEQRLELEQRRLEQQNDKDQDDFKQLQNLDREAELEQLKMLKDYDFTKIQRLAQIAAVDGLSQQHGHHHAAVDSDDNAGGSDGNGQINERRPLNADGRVYVNDVAGTVVVNAWGRNEVLLTGELGSSDDHLEITGDASNLSFAVKLPKHSHSSGDSDLRLMVPAGARVELETVSADASVQGTRGPLKVTTVSGDVGVDVQSQEVVVQTVSGDVILRAPSKATQANTVSGDLHLSGLQGKLTVDTVSGNLSVKGSSFSELRLKSVSGDMGLDASFSPQAMVTGETLSGTITLHVPADVSGTATIKSFSGDTQCDLPRSTETANSSSVGNMHKKRELVFGDGKGVNLQLSTFSGDVRIDRMTGPAQPAPPVSPVPPVSPTPQG